MRNNDKSSDTGSRKGLLKNRCNKKKLKVFVFVVLLFLVLLFLIELLYSNYTITVSKYTVQNGKIVFPIRIVFLSDLHGRRFSSGNNRLLKAIAKQKPDMIALVGDIFNEDADEEEILAMCSFIHACTEIAPTYFSMGNHENTLRKNIGSLLYDRVSETGAIVLDNSFLDLQVNENEIRIGGYMGYYGNPHMMVSDSEQIQFEREFFAKFEDTDRYKLLLNHIPTPWTDWGAVDRNPVDLVLSGHYHGGIVRSPFSDQGMYAPYIGWHPPFTKGIVVGKRATCVLTTGLAGSYGIPRLFNPPEICVVDIIPEQ